MTEKHKIYVINIETAQLKTLNNIRMYTDNSAIFLFLLIFFLFLLDYVFDYSEYYKYIYVCFFFIYFCWFSLEMPLKYFHPNTQATPYNAVSKIVTLLVNVLCSLFYSFFAPLVQCVKCGFVANVMRTDKDFDGKRS